MKPNLLWIAAALASVGAVSPATGQKISDFNDRFVGTHQTASENSFNFIYSRGTYSASPALTTLVSFNGTNGTLIADTHGDLLGTTQLGGANGDGTVFEIADSGFRSVSPHFTDSDSRFRSVSPH